MSNFLRAYESGDFDSADLPNDGPATATNVAVWGRPLQFWTRFALVWLMAITVTGAAVRLTGSGLGCTDWPTCSVNTELEAPGFHSAIEFGNRMISGLAILPVIAAFIGARRARRDLLPVIYATVFGFLGQVLLGMAVTRTELDPRVVIGHFLLSIVLIWLGVVMDYRARHPKPHLRQGDVTAVNSARRSSSRAMFVAASVVIIVGTLVTGSGPHTGSESSGEPIPRLGFDIREITRIHSLLGWVLVIAIVVAMVQCGRASAETSGWSRLDRTWLTRIGGLALFQGAIGYLQYNTGVPVGLVAVHIAGSVLLWTTITWYAMVASDPLRERSTDRPQSLVT